MNEHKKLRRRAKLAAAISLCAAAMGSLPAIADSERWYTHNQLEQGAAVFAQHCAECHGPNAEAKPDWRVKTPEGKFPPPPLNGNAHAWHHPLDVLRRQIRLGGAPLGGAMPAFKDKLTDGDIDAAIAFFQSKWSDEIYAAWSERDGSDLIATAAPPAQDSATRLLRQRFPKLDIGEPEPTPVEGIVLVKAGDEYVYLTADGRHAFVGSLLDLETGANLTEVDRARDRLAALSGFADADRVIFPAQGEEQARLTVFTDTSCPYCRKLHHEVPELQSAGVTVTYIPFPRSGPTGLAYETMRRVWCSPDRRAAMNIAQGVTAGKLEESDCEAGNSVKAGYELGARLGVNGTPAIVLPDGRLQPGYMPADRLLSVLGLSGRTTSLLKTP